MSTPIVAIHGEAFRIVMFMEEFPYEFTAKTPKRFDEVLSEPRIKHGQSTSVAIAN